MAKEKLTHESFMPIGTHAGKRMDEVPVDWYIWFYAKHDPECHNGKKIVLFGVNKQIMNYIKENYEKIEDEWDRKYSKINYFKLL